MKITVCFDSVRVIVPCGNGDLSVEELTQRAIARYKKATNKQPDDIVQVQVLETTEERAILDPVDVVSDVLDDKDKVVAVFDEQPTTRPVHNGGDGMSVSSVGTASPDIFQSDLTNFHNGLNSKTNSIPTKDENHNNATPSKLVVVSSLINEKLPPPPVAPKPRGYKKKDTHVVHESLPSEDSGICVTTRNRIGSDSSKSELSEVSPRLIRTAETAFVAIGTPIQVDKQFNFNGNTENKKNENEAQKDFEEEDDDGTFSLGRNSARQSMFVDNPVLDRWAELQHKRILDEQDSGRVSVEEREDPAGASMSPTEERTFENNIHEYGDHQVDGSDSICSGESDDTLTISLQPETPGDLGFKVAGYKTADERELGLIVREISSTGCAAKDGQLQIADRILQINGKHLVDIPNQRAEEIFAQESEAPMVKLMVSGAHSFVNENKQNVNEIQISETIEETKAIQEQALPSENNGIEPPPGFRDMRRSNEFQLSTSVKKINKRFLIELNKGSDGLGFSITTRDNPAGVNTPIFVKGILAKGAAIEDGQLRSGDQIVEVNGTEMSGKSQGEAVNILRSTRGLVKLLIQREEIIQAATKPAVEVNEESTRFLREQGKHVLTFKIPLSYSGAAGLGISVKGKMDGDSPQDKGIYVKSVIAGGAAQKDGRLQADDQLLSVNNVSFLGIPNAEAIEKLRTAMQTTRLGQAFIEVTIARLKDKDAESIHELQQSEQEERPIEAGLQEPVQNSPIETSQQAPVQYSPTETSQQGLVQNRPIEASQQGLVQNRPIEVSQQGLVQNRPLEHKLQHNVPEVPKQDSQEDEDDFTDGVPVPLNLSPSRYRNVVQRNESYCFAIGGPLKRPIRPSPLLVKQPETFQDRPSSTVAMPTPPCTTNGQTKGRNPTPVPPPRGDSFNSATLANYQIQKHMSTSSTNVKHGVTDGSQLAPSSPTKQKIEENSARRSYNRLPSYQQTIERLRSRSTGSADESREELQDTQDVVFANPDIIIDSPFEREGFGRQSMSEKKARSSVDAKKTQMYQIREKQKEMNKSSKRPSSEHDMVNGSSPLRKAKSEGYMQTNAINGGKNTLQMWKSTSDTSLKSNEVKERTGSHSNPSFRSAIGGNPPSGTMPNGMTRPSQSEEQEIPITMTSKADFNAVQQKLAKKPFYRKFKIGKTRRGEYNLADADRSPKHSLYGQEALIDFPSEQRYRQLVSHYDDDVSDRSSSLPNPRRRVDQTDGDNSQEQRSNVKIGRVIMSEPTRV